MINFTSILTTIKGASLATKISLGVGAVAIVVSGTAVIVTLINANQPKEPEIVADNSNTDNSLPEQEDAEAEETKTEDQKTEPTGNNQKPATNNSQATAKPSNNSPTSSNQSSSTSFSSKPSTSTTQPSQPSQPTQPTKKPDYNLNDRYVAGSSTYAFYTYDGGAGQCSLAEKNRSLA